MLCVCTCVCACVRLKTSLETWGSVICRCLWRSNEDTILKEHTTMCVLSKPLTCSIMAVVCWWHISGIQSCKDCIRFYAQTFYRSGDLFFTAFWLFSWGNLLLLNRIGLNDNCIWNHHFFLWEDSSAGSLSMRKWKQKQNETKKPQCF